MKQKDVITQDMTIDEIFANFPQKGQRLAQEMTNAGLHCVGCHAATWESLEMGMLGHGFDEQDIKQLVDKLNSIIKESVDTNTISLTKNAADKVREILKKKNKEGWALRFGDKPGGCGGFEYIFDFSNKPTEEDEVSVSNGIEIHVSQKVVKHLIGSEIDYQEGLMESGFNVTNPNVKGSCSCGSSQSY